MTFKDRVRRTISSRNTPASPTNSSPTSSPTTTQPSSRNASSSDLSSTTSGNALSQTTTLTPTPTAPALEHTSTLKSITTSSSTKTTSSLRSLSKKFTLRREKKEVFGKSYDPQSAAVLGAWQWNSDSNGNGRLGVNAGRNSVWSAVSPNTSRRGSAISGYAVAREIERVEGEMDGVRGRLEGLAVA